VPEDSNDVVKSREPICFIRDIVGLFEDRGNIKSSCHDTGSTISLGRR
jgi:hypothetical protein